MSEIDETMAQLLRHALPVSGEDGDWERVVRDAARRPSGLAGWIPTTRRRRLVAAVVLAAMAVLIPLAALAASNGWWFLGARHVPSPSGDVIVVRSGSGNGVPWALSAYRTGTGALCVGLTPYPPSARPANGGRPASTGARAESAILSCVSALRGLPELRAGARPHWISFETASTATGKALGLSSVVAGVAAERVATVDVILSNGTTITTKTFPAPRGLALPVRFYFTWVPLETTVRAVVARDAGAGTLERLSVPG